MQPPHDAHLRPLSLERGELSRIGPRLRVILQLGASVAVLAFLISRLDWQRSIALIRSAESLLLVGVVAIQTADRVLMALKWHQLLRVLDDRFGRWSAIRVYYESTFVGFALPLGGLGSDIVRFVRLRGQGVNRHVALASMITERLNGVVATLAIIVVGLGILTWLAPQPALRQFALVSTLGAAGVGAISGVLIFYPALSRRLVRWVGLRAALQSERFAKYIEAARAYSARRLTLAINLALSVIEQTAPVFTLWVASHALGVNLPWTVCLAVAPVSILIQRLPLTYAGLGLREGSAAALLVALGYDYSEALVVMMTLFVMFLITLLPGAVMLAVSGRPQIESPRSPES
ncbi:MAG TPA: lysylphosphatidylglycerol synthase transmembrane domain-containing protein [Steroidobacteraceae bacterium]